MPTNAEVIFWIVCAVIALLVLAGLVLAGKRIEQADRGRMFYRPDTNLDDMEDGWEE